MRQRPQWWELPGVRELGQVYGPEMVRVHLVNRGVTVTNQTVRDRFWRLGWGLYFGGDTAPICTPPGAIDPDTFYDPNYWDGITTMDDVLGHRRAAFTSDKRVGDFNWRRANTTLRAMQDLKRESSYSQDTAHFEFDTDEPVCITTLSDLHMGSWGTDYRVLEGVTDDLLNTPNLFAYLLGDEEQMSIKMRSVLEVSDNLLPPEMQGDYFESWLNEVQHKILGSTWDNHSVEREEALAGRSRNALLKKRRVVYHSGIGHVDIRVGSQTYKFAVSHAFKGGRTEANPVNGQMRYIREQYPDCDVVMAGDSHVAAVCKYIAGGKFHAVLNGGTAQVNAGYTKRYFTLNTFPVWPCVVLYPHEHMFTPYFSVAEWLATQGKKVVA